MDVQPADVDETLMAREEPRAYVSRLAEAKAKAVTMALAREERWVLAADTVVVSQGRVLGKPRDTSEAQFMLRRLAGRTHQVLTAFAMGRAGLSTGEFLQVVSTDVMFRAATDAELSDYVAAGEWRDKAGGYAVQGMGAGLVAGVTGSITNVIGLPLAEVLLALGRVGIEPRYSQGIPA